MALILNNMGLQMLLLMALAMGSSALSVEESANLLLEVKALLIDPLGLLKSWTQERASTLCKDWHGITCDNSSSVIIDISLPHRNLSGSLSPALGSLGSLQALNMSSNMLGGTVPSEIAGCGSLRSLDLSNNNFSGELPVGFSQLVHLETLSFWTNSFVGPIPEDIVLCSQLKHLDLGGSYLEGEIPDAIGNLSNLVYLTLAGNELTGEIPSTLGRLRKLEWIYIGYNQLTGSIPPQLGEIPTLKHLDLVHNNLSGEFPHSLTNLTNLEYLFLYDNQLVGTIPPSIANLTKLFSLDLSSNMMSGRIPSGLSNLTQLQILNLFDNGFSGEIPHTLAEMKTLQVLALWMNKLTGEVPSKLGSLNNLTLLDLSSNELRGPIPEHLCASTALHNLILFSNSMSGPFPWTLAACHSLRRVRLEGNLFSGSIPAALASLPNVYYLDLSSNNFTGGLDSFAWNMPSLQVLHLQGNHLTGSIPPSLLQNSASIETLDLSRNALTGHIPFELGSLIKLNKLYLNGNMLSGTILYAGFLRCKQLTDINLSNNQLSGSIPTDMIRLTSLSLLDLSHNEFSGVIPPQLGDLDSLVFVNLSFNHLYGEVPQSGAFIRINASLIEGNPGLCGGSLGSCTAVYPASEHALSARGSIKARVTAIVFLLGLMMCVVGFGNVIWKIRHGQKMIVGGKKVMKLRSLTSKAVQGEWKLTLFQTIRFGPSIDDILEAMTQENIIEKRSSSCVLYKSLTKEGIGQFAAMEIIGSMSRCENQVKTRVGLKDVLDTLSQSRHPNIVNVYGICCGMESSILVLELVEGCSLRGLLQQHGHHHNAILGMERRLCIAIDIAEAIVHLHSSCSQPILHGSISSDKVVMDNDLKAHLLPPNTSSARILKARSAQKEAGSPEGGNGEGDAECADQDVRAFGEMLIELVSGVKGVAADAQNSVKARGVESQAHLQYSPGANYDSTDRCAGKDLVLLNVAACGHGQELPLHGLDGVNAAVSDQLDRFWSAEVERGSVPRRRPIDGLDAATSDNQLEYREVWSAAAAGAVDRLGGEVKRAGTGAALQQALRVLQQIWRRRDQRQVQVLVK